MNGATASSVTSTVRRYPVLPVGLPRVSGSTRWAIGVLGICAVVALLFAALERVRDPVRFPVTGVDVLGTLDYTDRPELQRRVAAFTDEGFYGLDIDALRGAVEALPWVASARIAREWPGRVQVTVTEHEPVARWNDDELLSSRLAPFRPPQLSPGDARYAEWRRVFAPLPRLEGTDGRHVEVLEDYRRYSRELATEGLVIERLAEDARRSQTLELARGSTDGQASHPTGALAVRLGYEAHAERMARFLDVFPRLAPTLGDGPASFDMRYANGFALDASTMDASTRNASTGDASSSNHERSRAR